jgi:hypothetical protein
MRTENDVRAAYRALARQAPDADAVLTTVRERLETAGADQQKRRRGRRPLAALASAAAVMAVIGGSIALAVGGGHAPHPAGKSTGHISSSQPGPADPAPRYYMELASTGGSRLSHAVIKDTATGATLATVMPPKPFNAFFVVTGAADDRTFVLVAEAKRLAAGAHYPPSALFRAQYDPGRRRISLTKLPIPWITRDEQVDGLALSPDGSRLAISVTIFDRGRSQKVSVYSMTTGAAKVWRQPNVAGAGRLSWGSDGMLAYNWDDAPRYGVWVLNTATAGGGLIASSRLAVAVPRGWFFVGGALLTPDGKTVVAAMMRSAGNLHLHRTNSEYGEFSAATGRQTQVLLPSHFGINQLVWASQSGSTLIVQTLPTSGYQLVDALLSGGQLTPIPHTSQDSFISF